MNQQQQQRKNGLTESNLYSKRKNIVHVLMYMENEKITEKCFMYYFNSSKSQKLNHNIDGS